jgi:hypothetical protein
MDRALRHVIAREDNVVHVVFDRDSRPPRPPFPGASGLRAGSSSSRSDLKRELDNKLKSLRRR